MLAAVSVGLPCQILAGFKLWLYASCPTQTTTNALQVSRLVRQVDSHRSPTPAAARKNVP